MSKYREALMNILADKVKVVEVNVDKEFIHLDKNKQGWRLTISKNLIEGRD